MDLRENASGLAKTTINLGFHTIAPRRAARMITGATINRDKTMEKVEPVVGHWYKRPGRAIFEVVAVDDAARTVELQFYDGTVDELDREAWDTAFLQHAEPPEDYSGSLDLPADNYEAKQDDDVHQHWDDPLTYLEQAGA